MDISSCAIKLDHSVGVPEPLPNWRQVPGFPVYGGGQPTMEGLTKVIPGFMITHGDHILGEGEAGQRKGSLVQPAM